MRVPPHVALSLIALVTVLVVTNMIWRFSLILLALYIIVSVVKWAM